MKRYNEYKDSGVEWLGKVPCHWDVKRLVTLGSFSKGFGIPKSDLTSDGYPAILYGDIYTKYDVYIKTVVHKIPLSVAEKSKSISKYILLLTGSGETAEDIGKCVVYLNEEPAFVGGDVITFEQKENNSLYISFLLNTHGVRFEKARLAKGEIVVHIYPSQLRDIYLPIPPLSEQIKIADFLSLKTAEIDNLIADKRRLIELYEEEKTALINQAVTKGINPDVTLKPSGIAWLGDIPKHWKIKKFKYLFKLVTEKDKVEDKSLPKIGLENVESRTGRFIDSNTIFEGQGVSFIEGDILFGKLRPYLAKVYLSVFKGLAVGDFYVFRPSMEVDKIFAKYRLLDSSFIDVVNSSTYGSKMPRVSWDFIADLPVAIPEKEEQLAIISYIESKSKLIDYKVEQIKRLIELLTEYRTALINEAVTGKIKVTD